MLKGRGSCRVKLLLHLFKSIKLDMAHNTFNPSTLEAESSCSSLPGLHSKSQAQRFTVRPCESFSDSQNKFKKTQEKEILFMMYINSI